MSLAAELGLRPFTTHGHEALLSIVLTGNLLSKEADRLLKPLQLTDAQFNILMLLMFQTVDGRLDQTRLGRMLLVNRSNVTGLVDRMERNGLVHRTPHPDDRRIKCVELTAKGRKTGEQARQLYFARLQEIMGPLSARECNQLCRLLARIRHTIDDSPGA